MRILQALKSSERSHLWVFKKVNETYSHGERTSQRSVAVHRERKRQNPVALSTAGCRSPGDLEQTLEFSDGTFCLC